MVPLRKSRGGQFLTPLGSPEDMDLEEVRAGARRARARRVPTVVSPVAPSQALSSPHLFPQLIQDISRLQRRSLRHSRQLEVPRPYIAARFTMLPSTFQPGDQQQYGGFDNRGLEPGHRYVLFVLAVLQKSEPVSPNWCLAHIQSHPRSEAGPKVASAPVALTSEPDPEPLSSLDRGKDLKLGESQEEGVLEEGTLELGL